jgi:hypothetical protein
MSALAHIKASLVAETVDRSTIVCLNVSNELTVDEGPT